MDASSDYPIGFLLTKLGQVITTRFAERLKPLGIRPKHYGLLVAIDREPSRSQSEIGAVVGVVPSAIVGMLDDLEGLGAVSRLDDPQSRRRFIIRLTDEGRRILASATEIGRTVDDEVLSGLSDAQTRELARALVTLAATVGVVPEDSVAPARAR